MLFTNAITNEIFLPSENAPNLSPSDLDKYVNWWASEFTCYQVSSLSSSSSNCVTSGSEWSCDLLSVSSSFCSEVKSMVTLLCFGICCLQRRYRKYEIRENADKKEILEHNRVVGTEHTLMTKSINKSPHWQSILTQKCIYILDYKDLKDFIW